MCPRGPNISVPTYPKACGACLYLTGKIHIDVTEMDGLNIFVSGEYPGIQRLYAVCTLKLYRAYAKSTLSMLICRYTKVIMNRKDHNLQTTPWHRKEEPHSNHETPGKQSKATSSLLPIETIAKLEWTKSNAHQSIEQLQNPKMGVTINNESTTTEPPS